MEIPIVFNIQKYAIHDGEGIRTTVFFKGCPLNCSWCHNPESQSYQKELMYYAERCSTCGHCVNTCPKKSIYFTKKGVARDKESCDLCESCLEECICGARVVVGRQYPIRELIKEIEKDKMFYEQSQGGVTLSGGEVMAQNIDYIETLLKELKKKGYHIAVDTCGQAPWSHFERVLPYVDTFLYDIKHMDSKKHEKLTGRTNQLILENLKRLSQAKANIYLRIPLIKAVNDDEKNIFQILTYIKQGISLKKIFLLPYHNTGLGKYEHLGRTYGGLLYDPPTQERLEAIKKIFHENGYENVQIGG